MDRIRSGIFIFNFCHGPSDFGESSHPLPFPLTPGISVGPSGHSQIQDITRSIYHYKIINTDELQQVAEKICGFLTSERKDN